MKFQKLSFKSNNFFYSGLLESSKSIVNRLLILSSYNPDFNVVYFSQADDVTYLKKALVDFNHQKNEFDLGAGGTTFRFFILRVSRVAGEYYIKCDPKILKRPQDELWEILTQLGVSYKIGPDFVRIFSQGWKIPNILNVNSSRSSQFLSSVLLNSWNLDSDLKIAKPKIYHSESYLLITQLIVKKTGLKIVESDTEWTILKSQSVFTTEIHSDLDASSLFTISCFAALFGKITVENFSNQFQQPDFIFLEYFKKIGIDVDISDSILVITNSKTQSCLTNPRTSKSFDLSVDLSQSPDLFPVLCAFLSFIKGHHRISGIELLKFKESDRVSKTVELLCLLGIKNELDQKSLSIEGGDFQFGDEIYFDPEDDHRMAFAAALLAFGGFKISLSDLSVVNKSFPNFWSIVGLQ